jgi:hypothetical protein
LAIAADIGFAASEFVAFAATAFVVTFQGKFERYGFATTTAVALGLGRANWRKAGLMLASLLGLGIGTGGVNIFDVGEGSGVN